MYTLPKAVDVDGTMYAIRSDYRAVLDIITALSDPELDGEAKGAALLTIFYPDFAQIPPESWPKAVDRCMWFISGGREDRDTKNRPQLISWAQDFPLIVGPVNRAIGGEIREMPSLHWWTFLSAFAEIGDCTFAQVVRIRERKATGKALDKTEREWYRKNRHLVDIKRVYTDAENDILEAWSGKAPTEAK